MWVRASDAYSMQRFVGHGFSVTYQAMVKPIGNLVDCVMSLSLSTTRTIVHGYLNLSVSMTGAAEGWTTMVH